MKIPMDAVILHLFAALFLLACADWQAGQITGTESTTGADLLLRDTAIKAQRTLDGIHGSIEAMRAEATRASPEKRAALERELAGVERLYQQTRCCCCSVPKMPPHGA